MAKQAIQGHVSGSGIFLDGVSRSEDVQPIIAPSEDGRAGIIRVILRVRNLLEPRGPPDIRLVVPHIHLAGRHGLLIAPNGNELLLQG